MSCVGTKWKGRLCQWAVKVGVRKEVRVASQRFLSVSKLGKTTEVDDCEDMTLWWATIGALGVMIPEGFSSMLR